MRKTPARRYAFWVGWLLTIAGALGFFYESSFTTDESVRDGVFGFLDVNGWHNVVHLASGLLGLFAYRSGDLARSYALGFGLVYLVVAVWGFIIGDGENILSIIPVNTEDNVLHALLAVGGLYSGTRNPDRRGVPDSSTD